MRKTIDAIIDILIIGILIFTVLALVNNIPMRFLLTVIGCGAMFNNCKYLYDNKKSKKKNKNK